jgi:hypothetical protein
MRTFKDTAGRTWTISVSTETLKDVRSMLNVDLMEVAFPPEGVSEAERRLPLLARLIQDPILVVDVLFVACKEEADAKGISDREFGRAMGGGTITTARTALIGELADFFPERGPTIQGQAAKLIGGVRAVSRAMDHKIAGMSEDLMVEAMLVLAAKEERERLEKLGLPPEKFGIYCGTSPENLESTPGP